MLSEERKTSSVGRILSLVELDQPPVETVDGEVVLPSEEVQLLRLEAEEPQDPVQLLLLELEVVLESRRVGPRRR